MNRPPLEVADLVRAAGRTFIERSRKWITWQHLKVLRAIARCRTAALGGHLDECTDCAYRPPISYNSCRNRHCPKCQANARDRWLEARRKELLPTRYVQVVFILPMSRARSPCRTRKSGTICCCKSVPKPFSKSPAIPTSRRRDRLLQCAPRLESEARTSPPHPLCGTRWRIIARPGQGALLA